MVFDKGMTINSTLELNSALLFEKGIFGCKHPKKEGCEEEWGNRNFSQFYYNILVNYLMSFCCITQPSFLKFSKKVHYFLHSLYWVNNKIILKEGEK